MSILKKIDFYFLIQENYKQAEEIFTKQGVEPKRYWEIVDVLKDLIRKKKVTGNDASIHYWMKKPFDELEDFVLQAKDVRVATREARRETKKDVITVFDKNGIKIVMPKTEASACEYGKGTMWCTSAVGLDTEGNKINKFNEYLHKKGYSLYYVIVPGGLDESLMRNDKFIAKYHAKFIPETKEKEQKQNNDVATATWRKSKGKIELGPAQQRTRQLYMEVKKATYNRFAILCTHKESLTPEEREQEEREQEERFRVARAEGRDPVPPRTTQPFDIFDNYMTKSWFDAFKERYDIPDDTFSLRAKKGEADKWDYPQE